MQALSIYVRLRQSSPGVLPMHGGGGGEEEFDLVIENTIMSEHVWIHTMTLLVEKSIVY